METQSFPQAWASNIGKHVRCTAHAWARESQYQIHLKREDITEKVYMRKPLMRGDGTNGLLGRQGISDTERTSEKAQSQE